MAKIYGTIESLKSLKTVLDDNDITQFSSVKEIKNFLSTYDIVKQSILAKESKKLDDEYVNTRKNLEVKVHQKANILEKKTVEINDKLSSLQSKIDVLHQTEQTFLKHLISRIKLYSYKRRAAYLTKNRYAIIHNPVSDLENLIENDEVFIRLYEGKKHDLIKNRSSTKIKQLDNTRLVLEDAKNLIAGAIGENLVVKEVRKLSDDYVLINDFNLHFSKPIYYKKLNQRISSIQIDHLLISKAGVFIIETKNWSKISVNSLSLRSPIEQIQRSNFALRVYLSNHISLLDHHWGEQEVPVRNLIVMINNKPKGKFKYVTIKLLSELNNYITYFEPVLSDRQFNRIVKRFE
ncbi:MAG: nuclease-related domain-containing protein [Nonlabens sp.]